MRLLNTSNHAECDANKVCCQNISNPPIRYLGIMLVPAGYVIDVLVCTRNMHASDPR